MTSRISKGSITGRKAFNSGGLGLSIGSRVSGGIRNAISRRAPTTIDVAAPPGITNDYQITGVGEIVYVNTTSVLTVPYLEKVSLFMDTGDSLYSQLFPNKLQSFTFYTVLDGSDSQIDIIFTNPESGTFIESLFTNSASNVHDFQFPDVSYNFTATDISENNVSLYLNNGKLTDDDTNATETITATFTFTDITANEDGANKVNDTLIPLIKNKQYKITMTSTELMSVTVPGLSSGNARELTLEEL